jgi:hypothetical protein
MVLLSLCAGLCAGLVAAAATAGCGARSDDAACRCTPDNHARTRRPDGSVRDGATLLAELRRHQRDVAMQRPARDIKLVDDELRLAVSELCQPCSWVGDRMTIEAMFPMDRLDDATGAVCMGLVLRDGTTAWGDTRPRCK